MRHAARKRFGQNFLVDSQVIQRICDTIAPDADELLIEIGPGRAAITRPLLELGARMIVVEIDRDLAAGLQREFANFSNLTVHNGDALDTDFGGLAEGRPYRLLGNLPYNISTPLIFHILDQDHAPLDMHFMLQKEVVERMAADPGSRAYGRLGVMCQNRCEIDHLFDIGPGAFDPAPKVTSAFVRLTPRKEPQSGKSLLKPFEDVVRQAFSKRRKTLHNSLSGLLSDLQIQAAGIDPGLRAERLSVADFVRLAAQTGQGEPS